MKFKYIKDAEECEEIRDISLALARHIHNNRIKNIMLLDESARLAHVGLREAWNQLYKGKRMPQIYFTNPDGYASGSRHERRLIDRRFSVVYKNLVKEKDQKLLVYDTCVHTGKTMRDVKKTLDSLGFEDVYLATTAPHRVYSDCEVDLDFYAINSSPIGGCRPFGKTATIEKDYSDIVSKKSDCAIPRREKGLRKELRESVRGKSNAHNSKNTGVALNSTLQRVPSREYLLFEVLMETYERTGDERILNHLKERAEAPGDSF